MITVQKAIEAIKQVLLPEILKTKAYITTDLLDLEGTSKQVTAQLTIEDLLDFIHSEYQYQLNIIQRIYEVFDHTAWRDSDEHLNK